MPNYQTNPEILIVQRSLHMPAYEAPGKWVLFEPRSRRSFLATGKDTVPNVIKILAFCSGDGATLNEMHAAGLEISENALQRLVENGLVHTNRNQPLLRCRII